MHNGKVRVLPSALHASSRRALFAHTKKAYLGRESDIQLCSLLIFAIVRVLCTFVQFSRESCGRYEHSYFEGEKL